MEILSLWHHLILTMVILFAAIVAGTEKMALQIEASFSRPEAMFSVPAALFAVIQTLVVLINR